MKEKIVNILEDYLDEDIHGKQNTIHKVYFDSIAQEIVKLFAIPDVVWQSEQAGVCMHNLDMTGKCFKCGEQYIRKEG